MRLSGHVKQLKLFRVDSKITLHNRFRKPLKTLSISKTKCKLIIEVTLSQETRVYSEKRSQL